MLAVLLLLPPDPGIADRLPVDFDEEQVLIGIAVVEVLVAGRDRLDAVGPLQPVGPLGGVDDSGHVGKVALAPEEAEAEAGDVGRSGNCDRGR